MARRSLLNPGWSVLPLLLAGSLFKFNGPSTNVHVLARAGDHELKFGRQRVGAAIGRALFLAPFPIGPAFFRIEDASD
jgi:hypothetical protein